MAGTELDLQDSILNSIKKLLGIEPEYKHFDTEIMININSVFIVLNQLGVGQDGFVIESADDTWTSFLSERKDLNAVKTYIYLKVRLVFDPPQTGYLVANIKEQIAELEWRLNIQAEHEENNCQNGSNLIKEEINNDRT